MAYQHVRYSFLVRNSALSSEKFREHYRLHHGPLALAQAGFRKYTVEYVQNHCLAQVAGTQLRLDGISATTQLERPDYSIGFFNEPDYAQVQPDEMFLFDLPRVTSVLSVREPMQGAGGTVKGFALMRDRGLDELRQRINPPKLRLSHLDLDTASQLGFDTASVEFTTVAEFWTDEPFESFGASDEQVQAWTVEEFTLLPAADGDA